MLSSRMFTTAFRFFAGLAIFSLIALVITAGTVVVFGETPYAEFQGDRAALVLDPQLTAPYATMRKLQAEGIPVIAVMITGRPLYVNPALNTADAFVVAWLPGSEGGGVADVLVAEGGLRPALQGERAVLGAAYEVSTARHLAEVEQMTGGAQTGMGAHDTVSGERGMAGSSTACGPGFGLGVVGAPGAPDVTGAASSAAPATRAGSAPGRPAAAPP